MSVAAANPTLPEDPEIAGNKYCSICNQSLSVSRVAAHLVSQKHTSRAEKAKTGEIEEQVPVRPVKSISAPASSKPLVKATAASKSRRRGPDADRNDSGSESSSDDEPVPSRRAPPPKAGSSGWSGSSKDKLPRDPNKEGNFWCGICRVSLAPTRVDAHLQTEKHEKNQMKVLTTAMHNL